jgi:hypothetical protein
VAHSGKASLLIEWDKEARPRNAGVNVTEFIDAVHKSDRTKQVTVRVDGEEKAIKVEFPQ